MTRADNAAFCRFWEQAASVAEAARKAGMTPNGAGCRASELRRAGVPLKLFPKGPVAERVDVEALTAVVELARRGL